MISFIRKIVFLLYMLFACTFANAQLLSWSPQFPNDNSSITITVDATKGNQGLLDYTGTVYLHLGLITNLSSNSSDWRYVPTVWGTTTAPVATALGNNKWSFTINNPRAYFNVSAGGVPASETILRIAILFRDGAGSKAQKNGDGSDMFVPVYPGGLNHIQFTQPFVQPFYNITHEAVAAATGQSVPVTAIASTSNGTLHIYLNGNKIAGPLTGTNTITTNATIMVSGNQQIVSELIVGGVSYYDTIKFNVPVKSVIAPLPAGAMEGINYNANCTSVTLVLYAPYKSNAVVIGDFPGSNWTDTLQYRMNKTPDGNYYWITVNGLTAGTEYSFEYLVDNSIYIADPYAEKILDPANDKYIMAATYPGLKPYPVNPNVSAEKNGIVGVLQTCPPVYDWKVNNFTKPDKRNLVTYELLVRDFGDAGNYQMLIDTLSYFKRLGINAIELMPVNEFSGNNSWGYNATFYCAPDKAYGTKNKLKEFIDICHQNGIAIILDVVFNQMEAAVAPQGKLYWDVAKNRPATNNPWLNIVPPHPYFPYQYDLNHESVATQYLVERSLEYWLSEYKVDGFRMDAGKGFTQKCTQVNDLCPIATGSIEDYDASRVTNLERYYDYVLPKYPDTYMIIEFLGTQLPEEQEYARHGFMLWGKNTDPYNQCTMGYNSNSNFSKIVYNSGEEGFTTPAEIGYMESHDEERLMFKNLQYGNGSSSYNVKNLATALDRQAAAAAVFFTVPGPKMVWQFGERGYDVSIDFNGRTGNKPPHWEYMANPDRLQLWNVYSKLINLRLSNPGVFNSTNFSYEFYDNAGLVRRFQIADTAEKGMRLTVIANFDVVPQTRSITFQTTGKWYNYISNGVGTGINGATGNTFDLATASQTITLQPGEYHVYVYQPLNIYTFTGSGNWNDAVNWSYGRTPPATLPSGSEIFVNPLSGGECILNVPQTIGPGAKFTVANGKFFKIPLNLTTQ